MPKKNEVDKKTAEIIKLLKAGTPNKEIAEKYGISKQRVSAIKKNAGIDYKKNANDAEVAEKKVEIKQQIIETKKIQMAGMTPDELIEEVTRAQSLTKTKQIVTRLQDHILNAMRYDFPSVKMDYDKDDYMKMKILLELAKNSAEILTGIADPVLPAEIEEASINSIGVPTQQYFGTGEIIEVDD